MAQVGLERSGSRCFGSFVHFVHTRPNGQWASPFECGVCAPQELNWRKETKANSVSRAPVFPLLPDCLHLQLYRDSKDRYKNGQTKASLSLQHFLGVESGFTLDKESNTIAIICQDVIVVLAFDTRERLIQWQVGRAGQLLPNDASLTLHRIDRFCFLHLQVKISNNLGDDLQYLVLVSSAPPKAKLSTGPARMHIQDHRFCLTTGVPPRLTGTWQIEHLR